MKCVDLYKHEIERFLEIVWNKSIETERVISNNLEDAIPLIKYEQSPIQVCLLNSEWQYLLEKFTKDLGGDSITDIHLAHRVKMISQNNTN